MELAIGKLVQDNLCNNAFTEQDKELNILNRWYGRLDCFIITSILFFQLTLQNQNY